MLKDHFFRPLRDLRISVTDRCNFRCTYCMPSAEYAWINKNEILSFEEITRLTKIFADLGMEKVRLTGGEPLLRKDLEKLVAQIAGVQTLKEISLTTNGFLLAEKIAALKSAGLKRINVSLDSLNSDKFRRITQGGDLRKVLDGIFAAKNLGLNPVKINAVIQRNVNDDEIVELTRFARGNGFILRLIEYMDVGNANDWNPSKIVSKKEMIQMISSHFPLKESATNDPEAPATEYRYLDGSGEIGFIASVTEPFCSNCVRARLTADGKLVTCLFSETGTDLKSPMRNGASNEEIRNRIVSAWRMRTDRYSEERWQSLNSSDGYQPKRRHKIEMITLGG